MGDKSTNSNVDKFSFGDGSSKSINVSISQTSRRPSIVFQGKNKKKVSFNKNKISSDALK